MKGVLLWEYYAVVAAVVLVVVVVAAAVVVVAALPAILMGFIKVWRWSWKGRVHCPELLGLIGLKLFFSGHVECLPVGCFNHAVFSMLGRWSQTGSHCHLGSSPSKSHHHAPFWNSHSLGIKTISKPQKNQLSHCILYCQLLYPIIGPWYIP